MHKKLYNMSRGGASAPLPMPAGSHGRGRHFVEPMTCRKGEFLSWSERIKEWSMMRLMHCRV